MFAPNIRIDIASVFKDKGFKQASKASSALERQFRALGGTFLTVFSTAAIVRFGKESAKAFADDEKAARRLEQTLKGVNLGFAAPQVNDYVSSLEKSTGILDDDLRPALEALIRTTGTVTTAQKILSTAIDVSAGSGYDLTTVANDLAKAYVGNTRGLAKYNTGLTKTELQTKSFAEIQKVLNDQFSGQRAAYLTTYAGKTEALRVAYANMQETIGKGLVDAFLAVQGENGIAGATNAMEDFGNVVADVSRGIGELINKLPGNGSASAPFTKFIEILGKSGTPLGIGLAAISKLGQSVERLPTPPGNRISYQLNQQKIKQAEEDAIARAKALAAAGKKNQAAQEKSIKLKALAAKLDKSAAKFDLERIQIAAALQGKISEGDRLRLEQMQAIIDARQAISEGDVDASQALIDAIEALGLKFDTFKGKLEEVNKTDPFANLPGYVDAANNALANLKNIPIGAEGDYIPQIQPKYPRSMGSMNTATSFVPSNMPSSVVPSNVGNIMTNLPSASTNNPSTNVTVNVQGSVITEQDLTNTIVNNIYNYQKSGRKIGYSTATI